MVLTTAMVQVPKASMVFLLYKQHLVRNSYFLHRERQQMYREDWGSLLMLINILHKLE